jgi:DDE family transposase
MTPSVRAPVSPEALQGLKHFRRLRPLLKQIHAAGTQRDRAGNRSLHFDEYCALVLLMLFNPTIRSLRGIQQISEVDKVQKALGVSRASLGSLSESSRIFDPELLVPIVGKLARQVQPVGYDPRLNELKQILTAVDGTIVKTLPRLAEAMWVKKRDGVPQYVWRLHTHFDVLRNVPTRMYGTNARNQGASNERTVLRNQLEADHCYVIDRGYAKFALFNAIVAAGSSYVGRLRDDSHFAVVSERPLTAEARSAGIVQDATVHLGLACKAKDRPDHAVRLVTLAVQPHVKRQSSPSSKGLLLIATNLVDVPADIIALLYQQRWTIEIFFRFFKRVLGCRHLLSACPNGIAIQCYCAIIACMLLNHVTGCKPSLRTYEFFCLYLQGWVSDAELAAHLEKIKKQAQQ